MSDFEEAWLYFKKHSLHENAREHQILSAKISFYSGALNSYGLIAKMALRSVSKKSGAKKLESLENELLNVLNKSLTQVKK